MITTVVDTGDEPKHVAWLNTLHDPGVGRVVVHVPPRCEIRTLAHEILHALGRTPEPGAIKNADQAFNWVGAWLATATPRADLVVYGTHRLKPSALALCSALGRLPAVNVWLVAGRGGNIERDDSSAAAWWPWSLFASHAWHERDRGASVAMELGGVRAPTDWDPDGLPPFPFSHAKARLLGPQSRQALVRLGLAYSGARDEIKPLLQSGAGPMRRNLAGAVARLALISTCRADISVLCRYLEHDVFLHNGLLNVEVDRVAEILSADNPFHQRTEPRCRSVVDGVAHSDPERAGRLVLSLPVERWRRDHSSEVDVCIDGTHFIRADGVRINVPPWARWPLRALVWQRSQRVLPSSQHSLSKSTSDDLYREIRPMAPHVVGRLRNSLDPLTSRLTEAIIYAPQTDGAGQTAGLMPQAAATAIWTVRRRVKGRDAVSPGFDDPGVQWLARHGLLLDGAADMPLLQPWLEGAVSKRLINEGPRFDYDYHADWDKPATRPQPYRPKHIPAKGRLPAAPIVGEFIRVNR